MDSIRAAYIHIPFCQSMCHYCSFVKYVYNERRATEYVEGLFQEINAYLPNNRNTLDTIYIGGGTPTSLNANQLNRLFEIIQQKFDVASLKEFTIEVNPGEIDEEKAHILKRNGINRISFGVQVMDDEILQQIGRVHRVKDVYHTVDLFRKYQFDNISLDLIYALPNQTVATFTESLQEALAFDLPHYSTYALQIEPKTHFYNLMKKNQLHRPLEDDEVRMYEILKASMKKAGVAQYEISNFAKPGYESKHNLAYWSNDYYYGFGAGASGYVPGIRFNNVKPVQTYLDKVKTIGKPILETDSITLKEQIEEEMFLGLRKINGYSLEVFEKKYGFPLKTLYATTLQELVNRDLLKIEKNILKLTEKGMLLADRVFEAFILDKGQANLLTEQKQASSLTK